MHYFPQHICLHSCLQYHKCTVLYNLHTVLCSLLFVLFILFLASLTAALVLAARSSDPRHYHGAAGGVQGLCEALTILYLLLTAAFSFMRLRWSTLNLPLHQNHIFTTCISSGYVSWFPHVPACIVNYVHACVLICRLDSINKYNIIKFTVEICTWVCGTQSYPLYRYRWRVTRLASRNSYERHIHRLKYM